MADAPKKRRLPFALVFWGGVGLAVIALFVRLSGPRRTTTDPSAVAAADAGTSGERPGPSEGAGSDAGASAASSGAAGGATAGDPRTPTPGTTSIVGGEAPGAATAEGGTSAPAVPIEAPVPEAPHGSLPAEVVRDTVREAMPYLRFCFEWQLDRHPELAGRVTMAWTIQPDGTVTDSNVMEDALGDDTVLRCFRGVIGRLEFPPPEGGGTVEVHYPFVLDGAPEARRPEGI